MRHGITIAVVLISLTVVVWFAASKVQRRPAKDAPGVGSSLIALRAMRNQQIDATLFSREQVEAEVRRRDAEDSTWEWKIPISFYGKAIDERGQPMPGADVHFQWTTLSGKGTSEADTKSDDKGLFSLNNVQGKRLLVRVTKPGYYSSDVRNRLSFEFANPFEEIYHQPRANAPVMFYLRKQMATADLLAKTTEVVLPGDGTSTTVQLEAGKAGPNGELRVQAWKPWPPRSMSPPYDWKIVFTLDGGGFVEAPDNFPFEAPEQGYNEQYAVEMPANLGIQWKVSAERTLFFAFGEPKKYGRLSFRTDGNSRYIFLDYVINRSGSRNLETTSSSK